MYNNQSISCAFREDTATIIALEDGGVHFKNVYQISVFRRKLIRSELINAPLFFCANNSKYFGNATNIMNQIFDDSISVKYDYAIVIESQVEFEIDYQILHKLSKEYMPARDTEAYQQYFSNQANGVIVFCRVYKVDKAVSPKNLQKGKQGSSQIIKLYDEFDCETTLDVGGFVPVLSDNKFNYIKDEILHFLKTENVFISLYQNNIEDNKKLDARLESDKILKNSHNARFDFNKNSDRDMAQLDYNLIYDEVISICPGMEPIINAIMNIQAARYNETNYFLKQRNTAKFGVDARKRLFAMNVRLAVKNALYFYRKYNIDIEDAFQEASIGILMAIDKYSENVQGAFQSYVSSWMYQVMNRNLPIYQYNIRIPAHYLNKILQIIDSIINETGETICSLEYDELLEWIQLCSDVDEKEARCISGILSRAKSVEELLENNEELFSDDGKMMAKVDEHLTIDIINGIMSCLTEREKNVVEMRYGLNSYSAMTLSHIGNILGLTRERVRQIESKAIAKMKKYIHPSK